MGPLVERPRRKSSAASPVGLPSSGTRMRLLGPETGAPSPGIGELVFGLNRACAGPFDCSAGLRGWRAPQGRASGWFLPIAVAATGLLQTSLYDPACGDETILG